MADDFIQLRKWMIGGIVFIVSSSFSAAFWISHINNTVDDVAKEVPRIKANQVLTHSVITDHSNELQQIRKSLDAISLELIERTEDRWHKTDAMREWNFHREREHRGENGEVPHSNELDQSHRPLPPIP